MREAKELVRLILLISAVLIGIALPLFDLSQPQSVSLLMQNINKAAGGSLEFTDITIDIENQKKRKITNKHWKYLKLVENEFISGYSYNNEDALIGNQKLANDNKCIVGGTQSSGTVT